MNIRHCLLLASYLFAVQANAVCTAPVVPTEASIKAMSAEQARRAERNWEALAGRHMTCLLNEYESLQDEQKKAAAWTASYEFQSETERVSARLVRQAREVEDRAAEVQARAAANRLAANQAAACTQANIDASKAAIDKEYGVTPATEANDAHPTRLASVLEMYRKYVVLCGTKPAMKAALEEKTALYQDRLMSQYSELKSPSVAASARTTQNLRDPIAEAEAEKAREIAAIRKAEETAIARRRQEAEQAQEALAAKCESQYGTCITICSTTSMVMATKNPQAANQELTRCSTNCESNKSSCLSGAKQDFTTAMAQIIADDNARQKERNTREQEDARARQEQMRQRQDDTRAADQRAAEQRRRDAQNLQAQVEYQQRVAAQHRAADEAAMAADRAARQQQAASYQQRASTGSRTNEGVPMDQYGSPCGSITMLPADFISSMAPNCVTEKNSSGFCQDRRFRAQFTNNCNGTIDVRWSWHDKYYKGKISNRDFIKAGASKVVTCTQMASQCSGQISYEFVGR